MIKYEVKNGVQTITEICEKCKCHIRNLTSDDILVTKPGQKIRDSKGNLVTRTGPREKCYCGNCNG